MKTPALLRPFSLALASSAMALFVFACSKSDTSDAPANAATAAKPLHLAFIPKGMQNVYWKSVEKGMRDAEKEANAAGTKVDIVWDGPPNEGDQAAEIALMETYVAQKTRWHHFVPDGSWTPSSLRPKKPTAPASHWSLSIRR